jgi:hypothetical protein
MVLLAAVVPEVASGHPWDRQDCKYVSFLCTGCQSGFEDEGIGSWLQHHQQVHPRIIYIYIHNTCKYILCIYIYIYAQRLGFAQALQRRGFPFPNKC